MSATSMPVTEVADTTSTTPAPANAVAWFEIPTLDLDRARSFYETLLATTLLKDDFGDAGDVMCVFPTAGHGIAGALVHRPFQRPADGGTMVYLNVDGQLEKVLNRARKLGVDMLFPRTAVPGGFGFFACIRDSEGNHLGLHSS